MAVSLDRLVRKEVALGAIRDRPLPEDHVILAQIAPFLDVPTDDVIFEYIRGGLQEGLAPARAEDAESQLSQKDEMLYGQGRAAVIDWSLKDRYSASDVTRYREDLFLSEASQGVLASQDFNFNFVGRTAADFEARVARHDALRRTKLDNRLEWLGWQAIETGGIVYNDGKIKFTVNYGRPTAQTDQAPKGNLWTEPTGNFDPIGDLLDAQQKMYDAYGVRPTRAYTSQKVINLMWRSNRFTARFVPAVGGGTTSTPVDLNYLADGYGPDTAMQVVERNTGITFTAYDSVYRTRPIGGQTWTNNRYTSDNKIFLLPADGSLGDIDDTEIGFAKMLTAPHPEGNFTSGYYEWEQDTQDPWGKVRGTGIKAFPVFPYMQYTYTMAVA